jgi:hypothetical protein
MRWRFRAAAAVFGVGVALWAFDASRLEGRYWPRPGTDSIPTRHDEQTAKARAQSRGFPTGGTIGFRDELSAADPQARSMSDYLYVLSRYSMAPVLLDRRGGQHDLTLVLGPDGSFSFDAGRRR